MKYRRPRPSESRPSYGDRGDGSGASDLRSAWADFIRQADHAPERPWAHFVTLTFPLPVHPEQAVRRFDGFILACTRGGADPVRWVRATERQRRGVLHFHVLMSAVRAARPFDLVRWWKRLGGGYADVRA